MSERKGTIKCLSILAASFLVHQGQARTIPVGPDPAHGFTTLQPAIDAALPGDMVIVAAGVYTGPANCDVDFLGKAITVCSANGPANCRIDCLGQGCGFLFHSGEKETAVLDGFTITHGKADHGGGICCTHMSSPTIRNCFFQACRSDMAGAEIIDRYPMFVPGPLGDYYLSQVAAGQAQTSPCCDAGAEMPPDMNLAGFTTRTDQAEDTGRVDIGYHYPAVRIWLVPFTGGRAGRSTEMKGMGLVPAWSPLLLASFPVGTHCEVHL